MGATEILRSDPPIELFSGKLGRNAYVYRHFRFWHFCGILRHSGEFSVYKGVISGNHDGEANQNVPAD